MRIYSYLKNEQLKDNEKKYRTPASDGSGKIKLLFLLPSQELKVKEGGEKECQEEKL